MKDPRNLVVSMFDASLSEAVAKAIAKAELNLNPTVRFACPSSLCHLQCCSSVCGSGSSVLVPVPKVSKEQREKLSKLAAKHAEAAKAAIRKVPPQRREGW